MLARLVSAKHNDKKKKEVQRKYSKGMAIVEEKIYTVNNSAFSLLKPLCIEHGDFIV